MPFGLYDSKNNEIMERKFKNKKSKWMQDETGAWYFHNCEPPMTFEEWEKFRDEVFPEWKEEEEERERFWRETVSDWEKNKEEIINRFNKLHCYPSGEEEWVEEWVKFENFFSKLCSNWEENKNVIRKRFCELDVNW